MVQQPRSLRNCLRQLLHPPCRVCADHTAALHCPLREIFLLLLIQDIPIRLPTLVLLRYLQDPPDKKVFRFLRVLLLSEENTEAGLLLFCLLFVDKSHHIILNTDPLTAAYFPYLTYVSRQYRFLSHTPLTPFPCKLPRKTVTARPEAGSLQPDYLTIYFMQNLSIHGQKKKFFHCIYK